MGLIESKSRQICFQDFQIKSQETFFGGGSDSCFQQEFAVSAAAVLKGNGDMGDVGGSRLIVVHIAGAQSDQCVGIPHLYGGGVSSEFLCVLYKINAINMDLAILEMGIDIIGIYLVYGNMFHFYLTLLFSIGHFYGRAICSRFLFPNTF